jgi:hypothetical protein
MKNLLRILLLPLLLVGLLAAPSSGITPAAKDAVLFSGVVAWTQPGSSADCQFTTAQCTINRRVVPITSVLSVSRASPELVQWVNGHWSSVGNNVLAISDLGLQVYEARTNKNTNYNANPTDLTNVTKTGDAAATLTVVDDSSALATALLSQIATSGKVYKLDNTSGSTAAIAAMGGTAGNINTQTLSVYARVSGPAGSILRMVTSTGVFVAITSATYARVSVTGTSVSADQLGIRAQPGAVVYFILNQLEEGSFATPPIITAGAAATRAADNAPWQSVALAAMQKPSGTIIITLKNGVQSVAGTLFGINSLIGLGKTVDNKLTTAWGGAQTTANTATWTGTVKVGLRWMPTSVAIVLNGGTIVSAANTPAAVTAVYQGSIGGSSAFQNGNTARQYVVPYAMSDAQFQAATAP